MKDCRARQISVNAANSHSQGTADHSNKIRFTCKQLGHIARNCPNRQRNQNQHLN